MTARPEALAVWLLAIGQTLIYAGVYYAFPALLPDLETATGWSKAQLAAGPTIGFLVMAGLTPFTGRLVDRGYGGEMLTWAPVLAAAGLAGLGLAATPLQWLGIWGVIGVAQAGCLYESCFAFLTRRLGEGARPAIIKVTVVAGFAGTVTFPIGDLLGRWLGGQGAMAAFGLLVLLTVVPVNRMAVRMLRRLERMGAAGRPAEPGALRAALRRPAFWGIAAIFGLLMLNHGILLTYILALFEDRGASPAAATLAAACLGPSQVLGRILLMMNEARIGNSRAMLASILLMLVALLAMLAAGAAPALIFAYAVLQGAGVGLLSILRPVLVADVLGRGGFGVVSGAVAVPSILASAAAPSVGALMLQGGGPGLVYGACLILTLAGLAITAVLVRSRRQWG